MIDTSILILSGSGAGQANPPETSAARLYQRVFGEGFTDPNSAEFTPDPAIIARRSVLSVVKDQRLALEKQLGAADRQMLVCRQPGGSGEPPESHLSR